MAEPRCASAFGLVSDGLLGSSKPTTRFFRSQKFEEFANSSQQNTSQTALPVKDLGTLTVSAVVVSLKW